MRNGKIIHKVMNMKMQNELRELLKEFHIDDSQLHEIYKRFCNEITKGLSNRTHAQSDIKCFVTYVQDLPTGDEIGKYLALDLGGTNFRVLLVQFKGHHDAIVTSEIYAVPKEIMLGPGRQLFDHIARCLANFVEQQNVGDEHLPLGFTFSFPCIQLGLTKALLVRWTKGFQCSGVVQEDVGRLFNEALERRGDLKIDVMAILNDTTGTLMSCAHRNAECRIGVIIGTGCNACYVEHVDNVDFLENDLKVDKKQVLINTEWGAFGDGGTLEFIRTEYDRQVDQNTLNAGHQLFEKMISGMYLGSLVRLVLLKAIKNDIIFRKCSVKDKFINLLANNPNFIETRFLSTVEGDTPPDFNNTKQILYQLAGMIKKEVMEDDCLKLRDICECISKRAAKLAATAIAGLINRINQPHVVVGVDGSVYRFHPKFDTYMREAIQKLLKPGLSFDLMLSEDGSGRGAALVAAVASGKF